MKFPIPLGSALSRERFLFLSSLPYTVKSAFPLTSKIFLLVLKSLIDINVGTGAGDMSSRDVLQHW